MTRLLLVPGSLRAGSFNLRLLRDIAQRLHGRCEVDLLLPRQVGLPLFDQDLEAEPGVMAQVRALHRRFAGAHGLVVASPAYNGQLTPYLKNLVDWVARLPEAEPAAGNAFLDRPVLLCSASRGGCEDAPAVIPSARALFGHVGATVLGEAVSVPHAAEAWTADGFGFSPRVHGQVDAAVARVLRLAEAFAATTTTTTTAATATATANAGTSPTAGMPAATGRSPHHDAAPAWPLPQRPAVALQAEAGVA